MGDMGSIPVDDISLTYAEASEDVREAVTLLLRSKQHIMSVDSPKKEGHHRVSLHIQSDPWSSVAMVLAMLFTVRQEYGDLWFVELINQLNLSLNE